ncbi:MAG: hypothetical protein JZU52_03640 [Lamprocystis purpurea]|jgi:type IV pilus assembly protein PilX|nr:hypothetical protein [Lamprocystis purpurea]
MPLMAGRRSRGSTLIVGMFLLLLMSVVSLTVLKAIKTDERMAGNLQDRNLAFQAAESALREAEELLVQPSLPSFVGSNGLYRFDDAKVPAAFNLDSTNARIYGHDLIGIALRPRYIIEMMEAGVEPGNSLLIGVNNVSEKRATFRITALGFGGSATTRVVLQSTYRR